MSIAFKYAPFNVFSNLTRSSDMRSLIRLLLNKKIVRPVDLHITHKVKKSLEKMMADYSSPCKIDPDDILGALHGPGYLIPGKGSFPVSDSNFHPIAEEEYFYSKVYNMPLTPDQKPHSPLYCPLA